MSRFSSMQAWGEGEGRIGEKKRNAMMLNEMNNFHWQFIGSRQFLSWRFTLGSVRQHGGVN